MDDNRAIGRDGGLPWHLPADLRHFKRTTTGHSVVMGRRTYDEVGKPLPGRQNIILSRRLTRAPAGCELAADLDAALSLARSREVMIIGGGQIYEQAMDRADRLVVTHVQARVEGADTWFPRIDARRWLGQLLLNQTVDERHQHAFEVRDYRWRLRDGRRLCRSPRAGGRPVRIDGREYAILSRLLLERFGRQPEGATLTSVADEILEHLRPADRGAARWRLLRVKLELEAAGRLRRLPGPGNQRLVLA